MSDRTGEYSCCSRWYASTKSLSLSTALTSPLAGVILGDFLTLVATSVLNRETPAPRVFTSLPTLRPRDRGTFVSLTSSPTVPTAGESSEPLLEWRLFPRTLLCVPPPSVKLTLPEGSCKGIPPTIFLSTTLTSGTCAGVTFSVVLTLGSGCARWTLLPLTVVTIPRLLIDPPAPASSSSKLTESACIRLSWASIRSSLVSVTSSGGPARATFRSSLDSFDVGLF